MTTAAKDRPGADVGEEATTGSGEPAQRRWHLWYCGFFFLLPIDAALAPRAFVPLLLVAAALAALGFWRSGAGAPWPRPDSGLAIVLGLLVLWSAIASIWSFDPASALWLSVRISGLLVAGFVLHGIVARLDMAARGRIGRWLVAGTLVALGILIAEIALSFPLGKARGDAANLASDPAVWLNRGAVALAILCWPVAAVLWIKQAKTAAVALIAGLFAIISVLSSLAAITGLAGGVVFALTASRYRHVGRVILIAATLAALIGSPLAGRVLYSLDWQAAGWLPSSAQHRVEIWHFTTQRIAEKPILGWGFDASRDMDRLATETETEAEVSGRSPIGWHPHNVPLQILLELGPVGAVIALAFAWILIQRLEKLAAPQRTFAQATYMTALIISCTAYGAWQNWWVSLLIWAALAMTLMSRPETGSPADAQGLV